MQSVSIIIPNMNGLPLLQSCIRSIKAYTDVPYEVIVVDNGSQDGSVDYCLAEEGVKLISSPSNRGFPAACNLGMRLASGDACLLLNNDVTATRRWLSNMLRCLYSSGDIGIVGPVTNYASGRQLVETPYQTAELAALAENALDPSKWREMKRLVGFCFLFKRELMDRIGLLDELFTPGHFEDDDYCYRARLAGFRLIMAGDTFVYHQGSASFLKEGTEQVEKLVRTNYDKFVSKWGVDPHLFI
jgi:GT2 family glycosyltransferase